MKKMQISKKSPIKNFLAQKSTSFRNFLYKNRRPILLITGSGLIYLVFKNSFVAFAADEEITKFTSLGEQLTGGSPLKKRPKTYLGQAKEVGMTVLGLRVYWDPKATPIQKASAAGRLACCTTAIVLGAAAELSPPASYTKAIFATCCAASWTTYAGLSIRDAKNLFLGNKK